MLELVRVKYMQNEGLKRALLTTGNITLGETGSDTFYSIGMSLTHPNVVNCRKWKSSNQLGKALETMREYLAYYLNIIFCNPIFFPFSLYLFLCLLSLYNYLIPNI